MNRCHPTAPFSHRFLKRSNRVPFSLPLRECGHARTRTPKPRAFFLNGRVNLTHGVHGFKYYLETCQAKATWRVAYAKGPGLILFIDRRHGILLLVSLLIFYFGAEFTYIYASEYGCTSQLQKK
jgi:hypothetical protein